MDSRELQELQETRVKNKPELQCAMPYSAIGDGIVCLQLLLTAVYAVAVVGHALNWWTLLPIFGANWASDGFCLSFKATLYHTHLLCLYADTFFAVILLILSKYANNRPELNEVKKNIVSVFFHGLAHGYLWYVESPASSSGDGTMNPLGYYVIAPFYFSFIHLMTESPLWLSLLQTVIHSIATGLVPHILIFTYVNTVITFNLTLSSFWTSPRDVFFMLKGLLIGLPIIAATFLEPILCDSFLVNWGGHIIFDISIPLGVITYFVVASQLPPRSVEDAKSKTA